MSIAHYPDGRMSPQQAADYVGCSMKTLAMKRCTGTGPEFVKVGGRIFYYQADLDLWINRHGKLKTTAQARLKPVNG